MPVEREIIIVNQEEKYIYFKFFTFLKNLKIVTERKAGWRIFLKYIKYTCLVCVIRKVNLVKYLRGFMLNSFDFNLMRRILSLTVA